MAVLPIDSNFPPESGASHSTPFSPGSNGLERWLWAGLVLILLGTYAYVFGRMPIFAGDTDLWYHLNGGRYFWDTGRIANHSFFSFIEPARERVDYYWLFQAIVYKVYEFSGYPGLIAARALLFLAFLASACALFQPFHTPRGQPMPILASAALVLLLALVAGPRYLMLRPHAASYLLALTFILVLERHRRWVPLLPLLAAIWVNVHGVTYPVLFIIGFSYLGGLGIKRLRRPEQWAAADLRTSVFLVLSLLCVYATPHGSKLLAVPFTSTHYASLYIEELKPTVWREFVSLHFGSMGPDAQTSFNLLTVLTLWSLGRRLWTHTVKLSHFLLLLGAAILLLKGRRLTVEFSILAVPLLFEWAKNLDSIRLLRSRRIQGFGLAAIGLLLASLGHSLTEGLPRYPFSSQNLPVGVTNFLRHVGVGGRVLNDHNTGGYTQWALYPDYMVYMDMEVPFLFTDEDMFRSLNSFIDAEMFAETVRRYRPDFLSVNLRFKDFPKIVERHPRYQLVFFDQTVVLYADVEKHPELREKYGYNELKPFHLAGADLAELRKEWNEEGAVEELRRTLEVYPASALPNQVLAMLLRDREEYEAALPHAKAVVEAFPNSAAGYTLLAEVLRGLERNDEALVAYRQAVRYSGGTARRKAYRQMGLLLSDLERYEEAYRALSQGIEVYGAETTHADLFYLASAAFLTERLEEARTLILFSYEKVPPEDAEWMERLEKYLTIFDIEPWKKPS